MAKRTIICILMLAFGAAACTAPLRFGKDFSEQWLRSRQELKAGEGILVFSIEPIIKRALAVEEVRLSGASEIIIAAGRFAGPVPAGEWSFSAIVVRDLKSGVLAALKPPAGFPKINVSAGRPANFGQIILGVGEEQAQEIAARREDFSTRGIDSVIINTEEPQIGVVKYLYLPKGNPIENDGRLIKVYWGQHLAY